MHVLVFLAINAIFLADAVGKYSKEMNKKLEKQGRVLKDRPFRSNKVNLIWEKAQKVSNNVTNFTVQHLQAGYAPSSKASSSPPGGGGTYVNTLDRSI